MGLLTTEQKYKDLLNRLGVNGHDDAIAEITSLRKSCGLDNESNLVENLVSQKTASLKKSEFMVVIDKSKLDSYWYNKKIGKKFIVTDYDKQHYKVVKSNKYIEKKDASRFTG